MSIWNRVHWFDLTATSGVLSISIQAPLSRVIILCNDSTSRTTTLWISERFVAVTCIRRITLHAVVVHCSNFNN